MITAVNFRTIPRLVLCRNKTILSYSLSIKKNARFISASKDSGVNALILGKPGGGKGTISGKIISDFNFYHLSTGDTLRKHVRECTPVGIEANEYMEAGDLVPDDVVIRLLLNEIDSLPPKEKIFDTDDPTGRSLLLDGFPRTLVQAQHLDTVLNIDLVINLDVPTQTIVERISDRWIHAPSGRVYSYSYRPPKVHGVDDETGEALIQRDDDKPESVRTRLEKYDEITAPLINFYDQKEVLKTFQGTMSDVIYVDVEKWLSTKLGK
mmetsp:Transcript_21199/g.48129  ORF Transcript_21199/g.48129 Transcript_21199/m.48129 type:complete len:266 (-) Transcript_21199:1356-2153(-)|eukprot:CAMPEP_0113309420 /NCGR_PEP_ID=MMETSP0010_2-20120614/7474_1 /TAXON_ID=216773 ORGANISM="Corethron hystrix, Strain 308" /NCGR_SAMPLE_ID=MMETSP0010_2 /ASSEMBLY_ACC=CAM_ASM_000155 /LENGTH=265 /DNA_ID=CAMNT_0000164675 /DNA_START=828 /DNA_END=1625 /DNA_ORIENTATION=- /assembly_acc=CAM_ASM_000155